MYATTNERARKRVVEHAFLEVNSANCSEPEQERLQKLADGELMCAEKWLHSYMPNYKEIHYKFLWIRSLNFINDLQAGPMV
jgi:hypothetical protein